MTDFAALPDRLRKIAGRKHVLTRDAQTRRYATGYRFGSGPVLAVVRPGSLVEQWRVAQACVEAGVILIFQAANTGLTGGSTPNGVYDRPVVIINTSRINGIHLINGGRQVVCLAGSTLYDLERKLGSVGREPHSVIGSSCIGASVVGGVCNNSGGALVQRGPAFTQYALYGQVSEDGVLRLVNHLGIALGNDPEDILGRLQHGEFSDADLQSGDDRRASDSQYAAHVRDVASDRPARFNANTRNLFEASGSAGRLIVFAVRLDSFAKPARTAVFYLGTNDPDELTRLRREMLTHFSTLPVAAEYIHRDAYKMAEEYGKDTVRAIELLGTDHLPKLFAAKALVDELAEHIGLTPGFSDRTMQRASRLLGHHLPRRMTAYRDRYEHHLLLRFADGGIDEAEEWLGNNFPTDSGNFFRCTDREASKAFLHRFAVAGAAVRYRAVHRQKVEDIIALDIALPRNCQDWMEKLPADIERRLSHKLYYGHYFCHVFHQDYIVQRGEDAHETEDAMLAILDERGARYPAEHNVGHLYEADDNLATFYRELDPCNQLNPGIGKTARCTHWQDAEIG